VRHSWNPGQSPVASPDFGIELPLHRTHGENRLVVVRGLDDPIAGDPPLGIDAVNLIFLHESSPNPPLSDVDSFSVKLTLFASTHPLISLTFW
jgi:hypothetical protein